MKRRISATYGLLSVLLLFGGCTGTFSRRLVVCSPAAAASAAGGAPCQGVRPGDVTSPAAWGPGSPSSSVLSPVAPVGPTLAQNRSAPGGLGVAPAPTQGWRYYQADPCALASPEELRACRARECLQRARRKSNWLTVGAMGAMVAYGFAFFNFGSSKYVLKDDGGLGKDTKDGGSDKTGHVLATHIQTAIYSAINRSWGIPRKEAALRGAITAWSTMFVMEVGDGFSKDFGSSWTDLVANTVGATFGYFHETSPRIARLFDLRWEYWPSDQVTEGGENELATDIESAAYLLAVNLGALYSRRSNFLDYFDFQVGWASKHYKDLRGPTERRPFIGVGLNLTNVCRRLRLPALAKLFEYYQPPGISLRLDTDLND